MFKVHAMSQKANKYRVINTDQYTQYTAKKKESLLDIQAKKIKALQQGKQLTGSRLLHRGVEFYINFQKSPGRKKHHAIILYPKKLLLSIKATDTFKHGRSQIVCFP